jgi:ABC-type bacteriocin/lantibiotic exporter with double-glycine peptidase domain
MKSPLNRALNRFWRLLQPEKKEVWQIYFYSIFNGLIALSLPLGIQAVFNLVQAGRVSFSWALLIAFVMGGMALSGLLQIIQMYLSERLQQKIFTKAAFEFAYRIPRIKLSSLDNKHAPELVNRFFEIISVQKGINKTLIDFPAAVLQIIFSLILLSFFHPFFIAFGIFVLLFIFLVIRLNAPKGLATSLVESTSKFNVVHWLEETARTMNTFKLAGNSTLPLEKTDNFVISYLSARKMHFKVLLRQFGGLVFFKVIIAGVLLVAGGLLVIDGQLGLGQFVASEIIILMLMNTVEKLIISLETIYDVLTALEKIGFFTDIELENNDGMKLMSNPEKGMEISAKDLSFHYAEQNTDRLTDLSFELKAGQSMCISGFNGAGKFTLLRLLAGLYEDITGSLSYDGFPVGSLNKDELRNQIGVYFGEGLIFSGTIEENITMGKKEISIEKVQAMVKKVFLEECVVSLPQGYRTQIGPGGYRLSKSESIKLMLARCLIHQPRLMLIQDQFHVFTEKQRKELIEFLFSPSNAWTMVFMSNNADVAKKSDKILVLDAGRILIQGNLEEIKSNPLTAQLFHA